MKRMLLVSLPIILMGCLLSQTPKLHPLPEGEISVSGNIIYCSGRPFAELRFFDINTDEPYSESKHFAGLAIYYYSEDKEVRISPKETVTVMYDGKEYSTIEEMNRVWRKYILEQRQKDWSGKEAYIHYGGRLLDKGDLIWIYNVKISVDGKYVYYKKLGVLFGTLHKYLVEYGLSK